MEAQDEAIMGRPRYTTEDFGEDWQERVKSLASEGGSLTEIAVELGISRETLYDMLDRDKGFSDTIKECKLLSEVWWERQGRENLENKEFQYVGWYMNMKNRFGWKDRTDVTTDDKQLPTPILGGNGVPSDTGDESSTNPQ